ncbi:hypothetical protein PBI_FLOOF_66 [Microbacterium phage Floof]|uniref:Uncharacterized protein n=1 Tax=Microbacterium phage Floof TaxID=2201433 RepID=A0A2Z4Q4D1_9CAUD|nr:hypothetical protein PBI_FLOOF_66 [Microbacterium phage Floof]
MRKELCGRILLYMTTAAPTFAADLAPGMTIIVNGSQPVTVAEITRLDSSWVSNGVVHFMATNGVQYGLKRLDLLRFPTRIELAAALSTARKDMDRAYAAKGTTAAQLKRARSDFNATSRALARAEAAFREAEAHYLAATD